MNDFTTPRRMTPWALIISMKKSLKENVGFVIAVIAYLIFDAKDSSLDISKVLIAILIIAAASIIIGFLKYFYQKFHIEGDKLILSHGVLSRQTTNIPLSRVHNLRTKSGIFYRLLGLRGVTFDTIADDKGDIELILEEHEWQTLLRRVGEGEILGSTPETAVPLPPPPFKDKTQNISDFDIIKGALCQNQLKGFAILAALVTALYDKVTMLGDENLTRLFGYIESQAGNIAISTGMFILLLAAIYLVILILWTGNFFLRYGKMSLDISDRLISTESGLLSRYTCRLPREKATVLTIKQNPLEKLANCQTIALHQAENAAGAENEGDILICGTNLGDRILAWWLGDDAAAPKTAFMTAKSGKGLIIRKLWPHLAIAAAMILITVFTGRFVLPAMIVCSAYIAIMGIGAVLAWRRSRISITEKYVKINCGYIAKIQEFIKYRDIESVGIRFSPVTHITGRVTLKIYTNAQTFRIYSLKIDSANAIRNFLLTAALENAETILKNIPHETDEKNSPL